MDQASLRSRLSQFGQEHVLRFWNEIDDQGRAQLSAQLEQLDLGQLSKLLAGEEAVTDFAALAAQAAPPAAVRADGSGATWSVAEATERGEQALAAGKVAAVLVAGGQGTRLGFDQPKGMYPIGPVSKRTLFQIFASRLKAVSAKYGCRIPWYVMTSDATDAETRAYFEQQQNFGIPADEIKIFRQGTMPAVDTDSGTLLLAAKDSLALSPDGHGGTLKALDRSGAMANLQSRGIEQLFYFQVDNPLVTLCDPALVGHHLMAGSEMTTQVVRKRYPTERVGNVVLIDGRVQIIEYSDLPEEAANATAEDGSLRLWAGNIAVHVMDVAFLRRMIAEDDSLPFHRASKKVPFIDEDGQLVSPTEPNATKFERFIFDLLPAAEHGFVVEVIPDEAFAPVKNADGAETDTPRLARQAISALHRSWLEAAGVSVAEGVEVEIDPEFALSPDDLAGKMPANSRIEADRFLTSE